MAADLTLGAIPSVLDGGEVPFVLGLAPDTRRCLVAGGAEFRRGSDRVVIDWRLDALRLRAVLLHEEGANYLMASAGPILNEWWPLLQREGSNATRPLLSAGVARRSLRFSEGDVGVPVSIVPPGPGVYMTTTALSIGQGAGLTDESVLVAHACSLGLIKAALLVLAEYRTLVDPVPDIDVEVGGSRLRLPMLLDVAAEAAGAIPWAHAGG